MANYIATDTDLTGVANAIRTKGGTSESLSFPTGFVSAIQNIPSGGGGSSDGDVVFIDYDGTVVAAKTKAEINAMTSDSELPENPTHSGLTAQGWNWTVAQLKTQLTAMPNQKVYVGQMYVTTSGATEIDVVMQEGRLSPIMTICVNGTISVDWGDNTTPDSVTGSSLTTRQAVGPHNYASDGSYTIKISKTSGTGYAFYGTTSYLLFRKNLTANQNRVYANCVKAIRIGNGITSIGDYAFCYCCTLASITIPSNVTSIDANAFYGCYSLASITIPSNVTIISAYAFEYCYSLASITIPSNVTNIGGYAFQYCYSLASITIPSNVTSIGGYAFQYCDSLTSITIPSNVTSIGNYAFHSCYSLTSITIPSSVTSIGDRAFYYCYSLASITIPSNVTRIGSNAFYYCYSLASITMPSNLTSIGASAFYNCYSLASITIPSKVTSIDANAFYYCHSLTSITIPSNVTSIGNNTFQYCYGVAEYHFQSETVPTGGTTMFSGITSDCVIYVPYSADHSILEAYKTATNWSTYATYMQEEPTT